MLSTLKIFHIDYLSLDAQGLELQVLKTIPWNMIRIDVSSHINYYYIFPHYQFQLRKNNSIHSRDSEKMLFFEGLLKMHIPLFFSGQLT